MALFSISEDTPVGKTELYCYCQIFGSSISEVFTHGGDNEIVTRGLQLQLIAVIPCGLRRRPRPTEGKTTAAVTQLTSLCGHSRRRRRHSASVVAVRDPGVHPERY